MSLENNNAICPVARSSPHSYTPIISKAQIRFVAKDYTFPFGPSCSSVGIVRAHDHGLLLMEAFLKDCWPQNLHHLVLAKLPASVLT